MSKKSYLFMALVALAAVLALSACGSKTNNNASSPSASAPSGSASAPAAGGETKEITLGAKNFEFDQPDIKVKVGDTVKITLKNESGNHGLAIPDFNVNIKNGETATFTADKAGTYDFNCSIQCGSGHDNMTGTITVE
ncbi:cupredoxin domain-containing protein [Cohnella nanjingensis]|uniref:Cupredoxin domain-containing protein n=1 Tax=Cohnella nanjingensis TaxID=1387779 RepID=A0A7X0VFV6_9BACL|nr:cupredoxin domain-containing protein [Cohnella nanjingensis]MBB6671019.1 cupredoxin domain-containing protein [Cohnella nanjingensis]